MIQAFDSLDEMIEAMEGDRLAADAASLPWQSELAPGDFFVRTGADVPIFCEVLDPTAASPGASPEDLDEAHEAAAWYQEPHMRGFRFCRAFSQYCPRGELGDVHISTAALKITKEMFQQAQARNWKSNR